MKYKPSFDRHLIFKIPITPTETIQVFTSDGQDLTDYFHIISVDSLVLEAKLFAPELKITMYAATGGQPDV